MTLDHKYTYIRVTSIKSPSLCMTTFSASLTYLTVLFPQSHDCSSHVNRPTLTPPSLWRQKHTDLRTHDIAHSPNWCDQPRLANVTCACSFVELSLLYLYVMFVSLQLEIWRKCEYL